MVITISIWDLVANALIEVVEHTKKRSVCMGAVDKYFDAIRKVAKQKGIDICLQEHNWSDMNDPLEGSSFTIQELSDDLVIKLNDGVSSMDLRHIFRMRLSLQLMRIFADWECTQVLLLNT